ncbi:hypothetical protein [Heliomarina baculiformis]|uniref:hypothetical protein n=1 Tax=Heliomarina baculiformis TaxID=2872036 RepID=UPI001EE34E51|nr:hypothetical protein [Heliomarina baculiformis]
MKKTTLAVSAIAALALSGCIEDTGDEVASGVGTPAVGSASDLSAFEGARAGQAEGGIRALGYEAIRSEGLTTYWFNRSTGACARVTTSEGRYSDITELPSEDC